MNNGYILWEGPSLINQQPIVALLTGILIPSANRKTGFMIQSWIINQGSHPVEAVRANKDVSICGVCPLKGDGGTNRFCYVMPITVSNIHKAYRQEKYSKVLNKGLLQGRALRIGSYGEPTALPIDVWLALKKLTGVTTGYTHRYKECDQSWRRHLQASTESVEEKQLANDLGWFSYRIKAPEDPVLPDETLCPASITDNLAINCASCGLCNGRTKNIVVDAHGTNKKALQTLVRR